MRMAALWILAGLIVSAALYGGLEAIKSSSYAAGEAAARADVEAAKAEAVAAAVKHAQETAAGLAQRADQAEGEVAAKEAELKGMRDELAKLGGDDPVVFGPEWACWMRGGERCPNRGH